MNPPTPSTSPYIDGVDAHIQVRQAGLCLDQNNAASFSWDMVQVPGAFAQVGWLNYRMLCCVRFFWAWQTTGGVYYPGYWGNPASGSSYDFSTEVGGDGKVHMYKDASVPPCNMMNPPQCPVTSWTLHNQANSWGSFFGEVNYPGSDIAGTDNFPTQYSTTIELWNGSWASYGWAGLRMDCPYYFAIDTNPGHNSDFKTYTKPISHGFSCT